jgi:DNA-binding transcriptional MerR regulator
MSKLPCEAEYPIAAVSKLTGVSCHALRIWERRYGFPSPRRSASGHRRYGHDQVVLLRRVCESSRTGRPISELIAEIRDGLRSAEAPQGAEAQEWGEDFCGRQVAEFIDRMLEGDLSSGNECFAQLAASLGEFELARSVIAPAFVEAGERWYRRQCTIYQEHCLCGFLRRKLAEMIELAREENVEPRHSVLLGTVQGDRHEGGVLLSHLLLERRGWRVISLGTDIPVSEIASAVEHFQPDALALSFVLSRNINKRFQELTDIRDLPIFVGGRSILNYQRLARRHGLIPVPGAVTAATEQMITEFGSWKRHHEEERSCP